MRDARFEKMLPNVSVVDCPERDLGRILSENHLGDEKYDSLAVRMKTRLPREMSTRQRGTWEESWSDQDQKRLMAYEVKPTRGKLNHG
jgi:hypothetical protein